MHPHVIGIDYGTDSVRAVLVNACTGEEICASVFYYPRWKDQRYCNPSKQQFRQHPLDFIEGLEHTVKTCVTNVPEKIRKAIKAISVDTTGSTPVAVDRTGTPLALKPEFENNPDAMFVLWKDHTAIDEANQINEANKKLSTDYLQYVGGIYSSEWYWAKLLHILRTDKQTKNACYSFVEHCDWIPFLLTGGNNADHIKRSKCAAGHKALFAETFGGIPPKTFWNTIDPLLEKFADNFPTHAYTADHPAGTISASWAQRLNLPKDTLIGVGAFDAHMGAVGGQIEPYHLSKVMGTSTCDMLVAPKLDMKGKTIKGICGQVEGSIIPGMTGLEAGQSAFGDAYAWFKNLLTWPIDHLTNGGNYSNKQLIEQLRETLHDNIIPELSKHAAALSFEDNSELAVDWLNGRRTPDANQSLTGAFMGLSLASDAPRLFRSLAEATCFGAKKIIDRFTAQDIPVKGLIGLGGVAKKSPFIMQTMADITGMPIRIHKSEQTCAAGAAMFASTVAGIYATVEDAMKAMGAGFDTTYRPDKQNHLKYASRYHRYQQFGAFIEEQL